MGNSSGNHRIYAMLAGDACDISPIEGTATANKAVVLDSNKAIDVVRTASLRIGTSGSETDYTDNIKGKKTVSTVSTNKTLTAADSGKVFIIATDAKVFTLPATSAGLVYTFINGGADGNNTVTISPAAADAIHGTIANSGGDVELSGVDNKDVINTKATATTGNMITLIGDGDKGWYVLASTGIWASES